MTTIWQYNLEITPRQSIQMPHGAEPLTVQFQGPNLCLWMLVDPKAAHGAREFAIVGTGESAPNGRYIGTVQQGSILVWHIFEIY